MRTKAKQLEVKTERVTERMTGRVTQQSCEGERMLLIHDLSADSIII